MRVRAEARCNQGMSKGLLGRKSVRLATKWPPRHCWSRTSLGSSSSRMKRFRTPSSQPTRSKAPSYSEAPPTTITTSRVLHQGVPQGLQAPPWSTSSCRGGQIPAPRWPPAPSAPLESPSTTKYKSRIGRYRSSEDRAAAMGSRRWRRGRRRSTRSTR